MQQIIYQKNPIVTLGTNTFTNVPVVLKFDETPLISVVKEEQLGFTTEIPIYHADGTYLAKVRGTRIYPTEEGKKAGITVSQPKDMTVISLANKPVFEVHHQQGDAFRVQAELYASDGYFVRYANSPEVLTSNGNALQVGGVMMSGSSINGCSVGIWIRSNGSIAIGCA
jgi:hypothetical protein